MDLFNLFNFTFNQLGDELCEKNKNAETKECTYKYVNDNGNETREMSVDGNDIDLTTPEGKAKAHKVIDEFEKNSVMTDILGFDYVADAAKTLHECVDNCHTIEDKTTVDGEPKKCTCKCNKTDEPRSINVDYMHQDVLSKSFDELVDLANEYAKNVSTTAEDLYEDDNEYVANAYLEDTIKNWEDVDNKDRYRAVRTLADFLDWVDSHIDL